MTDFWLPRHSAAIHYLSSLDSIEGGLVNNTALAIMEIGREQVQQGLSGGMAEIGVHHGKSFLALAACALPGETLFAIDGFERQDLTIDNNGYGDRGAFLRNIERFFPDVKPKIIADSSENLHDHEAAHGLSNLRIFSIAGGHTRALTLNNLLIADKALAPAGICALDDILNSHRTGVLTGLFDYMRNHTSLVPFCLVPNKLLLCRPEYVNHYQNVMKSAFSHTLEKREVEFGSAKIDVYGALWAPMAEAIAQWNALDARDREELTNREDMISFLNASSNNTASRTLYHTIKTFLSFHEQNPSHHTTTSSRKKITLASTFPIYPPRGGGQNRTFYLYRYLAKYFDITIVSICAPHEPAVDQFIAPGLREIRIRRQAEHRSKEEQVCGALNGIPADDVLMPSLAHLTPDFISALKSSTENSDIVISSHPYLFSLLKKYARCDLWLDAHNVETDLKREIFPDTELGRTLIAQTEKIEKEACQNSTAIFVCSAEDATVLHDRFGADQNSLTVVPNGVDLDSVPFVSRSEQKARKKQAQLDDKFLALFIGSWHGPNIDATRRIIATASECPDVLFLILGSICGFFQNCSLPANICLLGMVDDNTKAMFLGLADCALNPMETGSGTNLKMLDYFAAGIPVISTPHGMRGLDLIIPDEHVCVAPIAEFPAMIERLRFDEGAQARCVRASQVVADYYSWDHIAERLHVWIMKHLQKNH